MKHLSWKNRLLTLGERTLIMGILNVTPDSFSDGGEHNSVEEAVAHALNMQDEGADILDVGGESTRPGAADVSVDEELRRVIPVIAALRPRSNLPISIDTYKAEVARRALLAGANMVNDVWGFQRDDQIANVVAEFGVPAILMHNQIGTNYARDILLEMKTFFARSLAIARNAGVPEDRIILDPGIGFGKTPEQNLEVMARLPELKRLGFPILLGTSRKSMIGKILNLPPKERIEGTIATTVIGIYSGVDIVRVHDVKENRRAAIVADAILRGYRPWIESC